VKPKLFFKNIGHYAAMSTYIHISILFNFSQIMETQQTIEKTYTQFLAKHEEPFRSIAKSTTDVRLALGTLPLFVLSEILNHTLAVAKKSNLVSLVNFASELFQVEVSHLFNPATLEFMLILPMPLVWSSNLLEL
jgi:hypothetical protein